MATRCFTGLLTASALCLTAPAGAADSPIKAKAAEHLRICSPYGVGYYYIPGTDTCMRLAGYIRYEAYGNAAGGNYPTTNPQGAMTRSTAPFASQVRFRLSNDVRTQTDYGTLRSYFSFGVNWLNNPGGHLQTAVGPSNLSIALERAFVQFAGFTIGRSDTFFAFYSSPAYSFLTFAFDGSSGNTGMNVFAYTHDFGNGIRSTLSLEDHLAHSAPVINLGRANAVTTTAGVMGAGLFAQPSSTFNQNSGSMPDLIANMRFDRHWGAIQLKGALRRIGAAYNSEAPDGNPDCSPNTTACGHPSSAWGWAIGAGALLKMPWDQRDTIAGVISYAEGASRYVAFSQNNNALHSSTGLALGPFTDAVYGGTGAGTHSELHLTRAIGGTLAFEHYWTAELRTSFVFGYLDIRYSEAAKAQIASLGRRCALGGSAATAFEVRGNCDPDWSAWRIASRTMWEPIPNLSLGFELGYSQINTAFAGQGVIPTGAGNPNDTGLSSGLYEIRDQGVWTATARLQRSFP